MPIILNYPSYLHKVIVAQFESSYTWRREMSASDDSIRSPGPFINCGGSLYEINSVKDFVLPKHRKRAKMTSWPIEELWIWELWLLLMARAVCQLGMSDLHNLNYCYKIIMRGEMTIFLKHYPPTFLAPVLRNFLLNWFLGTEVTSWILSHFSLSFFLNFSPSFYYIFFFF